MKTIAISFHGTERIQVPDERVEEFLEDFSFAYKTLLKQFNIRQGDIDIDYVWNEEEESDKVEKPNEEDDEKEILAKGLLSKFLNNEISQEEFDEELKKIYH